MFFKGKKKKRSDTRIIEFGNSEFMVKVFRVIGPGAITWVPLTGIRHKSIEEAEAEILEETVKEVHEVIISELFKKHLENVEKETPYYTEACEHPPGMSCIWCVGGPDNRTPEEAARDSLEAMRDEFPGERIPRFEERTLSTPPWRHIEQWHEDIGECFWTKFPVSEPYYAGSPICEDWPGYHTHFIPQSVFNDLLNKEGYPKS